MVQRAMWILHLDLSWRLVVQVSWPSIWPPPLECLQNTTQTLDMLSASLVESELSTVSAAVIAANKISSKCCHCRTSSSN